MQIIKDYIPEWNRNRPGIHIKPTYITVHNTANPNAGADAKMHARYLNNGAGGRSVSWHFTVDDKQIVQHLPTDEIGWHAGDGTGPGNSKSIGIEICENADGDYDKAEENAIWLIRKLMKEHNIPLKNVVPHKHWTGKNCPHKILDRWEEFISRIENQPEQWKIDRVQWAVDFGLLQEEWLNKVDETFPVWAICDMFKDFYEKMKEEK